MGAKRTFNSRKYNRGTPKCNRSTSQSAKPFSRYLFAHQTGWQHNLGKWVCCMIQLSGAHCAVRGNLRRLETLWPSDAAGSGCRTSQLETRARRAALPVRVRHGVPCVTADNRPCRRRNARAGHCPREQSLGKAVATDKAQRLAPASHSDDEPNPPSPTSVQMLGNPSAFFACAELMR